MADSQPMDHTHLSEETLNEYIDGVLSREETRSIHMHIASCPQCAARVEELEAVFVSLEALPDYSLDCLEALPPAWSLIETLQPSPVYMSHLFDLQSRFSNPDVDERLVLKTIGRIKNHPLYGFLPESSVPVA